MFPFFISVCFFLVFSFTRLITSSEAFKLSARKNVMHYIIFLQDVLNEINGIEALLKHMNFLGKHGSENFSVWLEYLDMVGLLLNFLSAESRNTVLRSCLSSSEAFQVRNYLPD